MPSFDVCLLGVGEEGHVASIFPDSPAVYEKERTVVAVRDCPKPPPTRVSLTLPAVRRAQEVWLMTTGEAKAAAVAMALAGGRRGAAPRRRCHRPAPHVVAARHDGRRQGPHPLQAAPGLIFWDEGRFHPPG